MKFYRVLIAEDEGLIARDIANRLKTLGHTVVATAATADEAIEYAADAEVVLMDIRLDGQKDGIDAALEIRARYHLPIIFLTAHADRHTLDRAKLAEPFGYIVKPMAHAALQTTLEVTMYKHGIERKLIERESWLHTTLNSVADAVVVTDCQGRVILANQSAQDLFGKPASDDAKNTGNLAKSDLTTSDIKKSEFNQIDVANAFSDDPIPLAILRDSPVAIDAKIRDQAVEGSAAPVKASGMTIGAVLTLRDVTLKRWQEQQLRQAQKMEAASNLAVGVSGEYSTLLAVIRTETQRLIDRFSGPSSVRQSLEAIQQATRNADEITRRLAGLGTREVGNPEVLSINGILRRMHKMIESVVGGRMGLVVNPGPAAGKIHADAAQIEHMVLNLVTAAASSGQADGTLLIETGNAGNHVQLLVSYAAHENKSTVAGEEGVSLDQSADRSSDKPSSKPMSNGAPTAVAAALPALDSGNLELSIAHSIATEYEGLLSVENNRFQVLLPRWHPPEPVTGAGEATQTILLIEPRERIRAQLHNFFEAHGYNLLEAANRVEALALLEIHGSRASRMLPSQTGALEETKTLPSDITPEAISSEAVRDDEAVRNEDTEQIPAIHLVIGDSTSTRAIVQAPVLTLDQPMTQTALLERARAQINSRQSVSALA